MKNKRRVSGSQRPFKLYDKVEILEDDSFRGFTGMVVEHIAPSKNGQGRCAVMIGDDEDIVLGLGPSRSLQRSQLKFLGKNLRKKVLKARKSGLNREFFPGDFNIGNLFRP